MRTENEIRERIKQAKDTEKHLSCYDHIPREKAYAVIDILEWVLAPTPPADDVCDHAEMNRQTANHIAQNQSLHKEAQDVLEEDIFSALQIAEKRAVICMKLTPRDSQLWQN